MNILITSAGRRVSLVKAFMKEIMKYFPDGKVFTIDMKPELSSACRISDGFFSVPGVSEVNYREVVLEICKLNNIKLLIPTIDTELRVLAENIEYFMNNGIQIVISSMDVIMMCRDKRKTHLFFDSIGLPRAKDIDINNPDFPFFVKPYNGSSSIGIKVINDISQLSEIEKHEGKLMFLEYLDPHIYNEFTVDMYFDKNHFLKCAVPRERLEIRAGEVSKSVTRMNEIYNQVCKHFCFCPGFRGCITLQLFKNINFDQIIGIEINPRFGGGYPLSYLANANFPEMIIREYLLNEKISFFEDWIKNLLMLRYDDEIVVYDYKG